MRLLELAGERCERLLADKIRGLTGCGKKPTLV
jgi:hypothetical protein